MKKYRPYLQILYYVIGVLIFFWVWFVFAKIYNKELILPNPIEVIKSLFDLFTESEFYSALVGTLLRTVASFFVALLLAIILAILGSIFKPVNSVLSPIISVLRVTPTMSVILLIIVFVSSSVGPTIIGFLIAFPLLYQSVYFGINGIDNRVLEFAKVYNLKKSTIVKSIYFPYALPELLSSVKTTFPLNLKVVIAAEVIAQTRKSMGLMMQMSKIYLEIDYLFAYTLVAIIIGIAFELIVGYFEKKVRVK